MSIFLKKDKKNTYSKDQEVYICFSFAYDVLKILQQQLFVPNDLLNQGKHSQISKL